MFCDCSGDGGGGQSAQKVISNGVSATEFCFENKIKKL